MFPRDEKTGELLSGWLDGELSSEEAAEFQRMLASDADLAADVERMKKVRAHLTNLPASRLGSDFAAKVLEKAQVRAGSMGSQAPAWIRPTVTVVPAAVPQKPVHHRAAWVGIAAIAASVAMIALWSKPEGSSSQGSSVAQQNSPVEQDPSKSITNPPEVDGASNNPSPMLAANPSDNPQESANASTTKLPGRDALTTEGALPIPSPVNSVASNTNAPTKTLRPPQVEMPLVATQPQPPTDGIARANTLSDSDKMLLESLEKSLQSGQKARYLLVVDATLTKQAWDDERFFDLLNQNDIPFSTPVEINEQLQADLAKSRMVDKLTDSQNSDGNVALVFVKARGARLDRMITQMYEEYQEFPDFSLDIALDLEAQNAQKELESIQEFGEDLSQPGSRQGVARALVRSSDPMGRLDQFASAKRRVPPVNLENRKQKTKAPSVSDVSMNPVEYCLFILRPSK